MSVYTRFSGFISLRPLANLRAVTEVFVENLWCSLSSGSLPPLAPSALPDFVATMAALTPAGNLSTSCSDRSPVVTSRPLPDILPPTTPTSSATTFVLRRPDFMCCPSRLRLSLAGSPVCCGRIVFTLRCCLSGSFGCSPPRLAATQLLQVLSRITLQLTGVFHTGGSCCFTAHERRHS